MPSDSPPSLPPFLTGGSRMAALIARHDWHRTSLGAIDGWPASLRAAVSLMLGSRVSMVTLWGEAGVMIYNDAYAEFAAGRHPGLLGSNVREGWPEAAEFNDHVMRVGLTGTSLSYEDQELTLYRNAGAEQVWLNLDYSPLLDDAGVPVGVMAIVVETTAKVRAERRVRGERERLRQMFEQAPGFMVVLSGADHVVDMANPAFMRLIGTRDLQGSPARAVLPELANQGFFEPMDEAFRSGQAVSATAMPLLLHPQRAGAHQRCVVDLVFQPLRNDEGGVTGIFVQGSDVSARVAAEEVARLRDEQFHTFAEALPNHVWAAGPDGQLDWLNERAMAYSGWPIDTLLGSGWARMVHPDDLGRAAEHWRESLASGQGYEVEFRLRHASGAYRWHLGRALPLRDAAGRIVRWIGTNTDIEEQKEASRVLASHNQLLGQRLAESTADRDRMWRLSTDLMLVAGFDTRIVSINPAWTRLLGWAPDELVGHSFMQFIHPDDKAATLSEAANLAGGETTHRFENRCRRTDGRYCLIEWTGVPDAGFIHAVGRDVTADREAAQTLKRTEEALVQSQKMDTVGKLTGGVAHDFNNLLQVISANLELLALRSGGDERLERYVGNALDGVRRGAKLASQLLAFARRQPLEPKVLNVGRLITGMEDMLSRTIGESVEIETVVAGDLWNCHVDPAQVENALLNLVINARDAMDGVGRLTIEVGNATLDDACVGRHPDLVAGPYVRLSVTDTGAGMTPEVMARAFEPFYTTKPEGKGTGLGLAMVYGFVKQSGGHVQMDSQFGQGSTVRIYLPRVTTSEEALSPDLPEPAGGGSETILVAEDDDAVRIGTVEMLRGMGYVVHACRDAASALAIVDGGTPIDLIFTDVLMPGALRSPEMARRAKERRPGIAVLFTSGYTQDAIVHDGRLDAGVELLVKPYTREALARKIRRLLGARHPPPLA